MEKHPKISIIMPVYNTEEYIEESIGSVLNQEYDNTELICVNDNSPDHAIDICKKYQLRYPEMIKVLDADVDDHGNPVNRGLEITRNRGLEIATGEYVLFLDSDDTLKENTLLTLAQIVSQKEYHLVAFSYSRIVNGEGHPVVVHGLKDGEYTTREFCGKLLHEISLGVLSCVGAKMYNAKFLRNYNLWFDRKYRYNEDFGFILTVLDVAENVYFLDQPLYQYLIRSSGSIMSSHKENMFSTTVKAREKVKELFVRHGYWQIEDYQYRYYREQLGLVNGCLLNEIKYGNDASYRTEFEAIRSYSDFQPMIRCLQKYSKKMSKQRLYVYFLNRGSGRICKLFLEANNWRK